MKKKKNKKNKKKERKHFPPRKPDVVDGGLKTTESAIDLMIDEGLGSGITDPHVNGSPDPSPPENIDHDKK